MIYNLEISSPSLFHTSTPRYIDAKNEKEVLDIAVNLILEEVLDYWKGEFDSFRFYKWGPDNCQIGIRFDGIYAVFSIKINRVNIGSKGDISLEKYLTHQNEKIREFMKDYLK